MLAKAELKLETGEVIPLQFGMWSKAKFFEMFKDMEKPGNTPIPMDEDGNVIGPDPLTPDQRLRETLENGRFAIMVAAMVIACGAENARVNEGNMQPVQLHQAMNWIDLAGGIKSEQVKNAISINDFFSESGEAMVEIPPKKRSPGRKSKVSQ